MQSLVSCFLHCFCRLETFFADRLTQACSGHRFWLLIWICLPPAIKATCTCNATIPAAGKRRTWRKLTRIKEDLCGKLHTDSKPMSDLKLLNRHMRSRNSIMKLCSSEIRIQCFSVRPVTWTHNHSVNGANLMIYHCCVDWVFGGGDIQFHPVFSSL